MTPTRHYALRLITPGWDRPYQGHLVRSVMGMALRRSACTEACAGPCDLPQACAYTQHFDPGVPAYRLRLSALDEALNIGETASISLTAWAPDTLDILSAALLAGLTLGLGPQRARFEVLDVHDHLADLQALAERYTQTRAIGFFSPTDLKNAAWRTRPDPGLLLPALHVRFRDHPGLLMPSFDSRLPYRWAHREWIDARRWSVAQERAYPIQGWVGICEIDPTPEQALWLALGELVGVGRGASRGQGEIGPVTRG